MPPRNPLRPFHPLVRGWLAEALGAPSEPQRLGWPAIASGAHTLILAPTGTGKTLAAFLWELSQLVVRGLEAPLPNAVQILYVSPLKALGNDIRRNLERPPISWRAIYRELKRLEYRGEVRRGYFVEGLGGRSSRSQRPSSGCGRCVTSGTTTPPSSCSPRATRPTRTRSRSRAPRVTHFPAPAAPARCS